MATETIDLGGDRVTTLQELLRPGLRAVFVGINPSPVSVAAGHYYQGRLGLRFWQRLQDHGVTPRLPRGAEDDAAFSHGFGFADLIRRPTRAASELPRSEMKAAAEGLAARLTPAAGAAIVFVFAAARDSAEANLIRLGWTTATMPGPYAPRAEVNIKMRAIRETIGLTATA